MSEERRSNVLRVAVLDLNNGVPNQGMRCIREILHASNGRYSECSITFDEFDVRAKTELPGLDYDVYLSTGGPGSPFDGRRKAWERKYFRLLEEIWNLNERVAAEDRKRLMSICHSFQIMCRYFGLAHVTRRRNTSFGIMPVHPTEEGRKDALFEGLANPFFAADFRDFQVVQPNLPSLRGLGARILAREKNRPDGQKERAIMAMRVSREIVGVQFHPEADPIGLSYYFARPEQRRKIERAYGLKRYREIIERLNDPYCVAPTYETVIPGFIRRAVEARQPAETPAPEAADCL